MSIGRRGFFKVLGVTGATLAIGRGLRAEPKMEEKTEFSAILYDATRCIGCMSCELGCSAAHGLPDPVGMPEVGVVRKADEYHRMVINACKTSTGESYIKNQCMHCNEPACAAACLTEALIKTKEGPVIWREDKCMGCRFCMISCPFESPKFEYNSTNPKIEKCDMCASRQKEGKLPACVESCPADALAFGSRRELIKVAQKRIVENPELYVDHIFGEHEAGGTGYIYLSGVPIQELGYSATLHKGSYPELSKGFLYSVPSVDILWPAILLGIREATKNNKSNTEENE